MNIIKNNKNKIVIYSPNSKITHRDLVQSDFYFNMNKTFNIIWIFSGEPSQQFVKKIKNFKIIKPQTNIRLLIWEICFYLEELLIHKFWKWPNINTKLYLSDFKKNLINLIFKLKMDKIVTFFLKNILNLTVKKNKFFSNVDLFISFNGGKDLLSDDLLRLAKQNKVFSIHVPSGWDNISSKPLMVKPNKILVWGNQTKNLCKKLHKLNPEIVGSARIDKFNQYSFTKIQAKNKLKLNKKFKYILVAGSGVAFNEIKMIKLLTNYFKLKKINNYKIIYRPHPNKQINKADEKLNNKDFKDVIIDPTLKYKYKIKDFRILLSACDGIISPFSTSILESQFVGIPCLAVGYYEKKDGIKFNWKSFVTKSPHLKILRNSDLITSCYDMKDLNFKFDDLFIKIKKKKFKEEKKDVC